VSGLYFSHPDARYFAVGKIEPDQAIEYAARKDEPLGEIEKWLSPNLNYEPGREPKVSNSAASPQTAATTDLA